MSYGSGFPYGSIEPYGSISGDIVFYATASGVANVYGSFTALEQATASLKTTFTSAVLSTCAVKGYYYPPAAALSYGDLEPYGGNYTPPRYTAAIYGTATTRETFASQQNSIATPRETFASQETSTAIIRATFTSQVISTAALITPITYQATQRGTANLYAVYQSQNTATANAYTTYTTINQGVTHGIYVYQAQQKGVARLAQVGLDAYLLYRGIDTAPDFTAEPWQTFTAPPFTTPALDTGHSYHFVLRKRNQYGIMSQNVTAWIATPNNPAIKPTAPTDIKITASASGKVTIAAVYDWRADNSNAGDSFLIYCRMDGTEPNPATDTPVNVSVWKGSAYATLNWLSPAYTDGATIKALVRIRRSGVGGADSINTTSVSTVATTTSAATIKGVVIDAPNIGNNVGF